MSDTRRAGGGGGGGDHIGAPCAKLGQFTFKARAPLTVLEDARRRASSRAHSDFLGDAQTLHDSHWLLELVDCSHLFAELLVVCLARGKLRAKPDQLRRGHFSTPLEV